MTPDQTPRDAFEWFIWGLRVLINLAMLFVVGTVASCFWMAYS